MEFLINIVVAFAFIFIGFYVTRALEKRHLPKIALARRKAISGKWFGVYHQDSNKNRDGHDLAITLEIEAGARLIVGRMTVEEDAIYEFSVEGSFYHNKYLRLNYTASGNTESAVDFGSMFLVLGDFPNKIAGKLAGYGSVSEALISGTLVLEKQKK